MRRPPRAPRRVAEGEHLLVRVAVRAVDQLVELDERLGPADVARGERVDRDPDHLLGAPAHLLEGLDQLRLPGRSPVSLTSFAIVTQ